MSTPTEELRAAAARLRDNRNCEGFRVDCNSRELLEMVRVLLGSRETLADLLEAEVSYIAEGAAAHPTHLTLALAVARAINSATEPGPGRDGHIEDKRSGASLFEQLRRAAGEAP